MSADGKTRLLPQAAYRVEVIGKPGFTDPAGAEVLAQMATLGIQGAREVRVGALYDITGPLTQGHIHSAAQQLLADPITQDFAVGATAAARHDGTPAWRIEVWLKPSVSDPTGDSVRKAVADLGLPAPARVRCGSVYRILGRVTQAQAEKVAVKLLANPVVHRYVVTSP